MKATFVFLCAFMAISHQQFKLPRGVIWLSPYYSSSQPVIKNPPSQYYSDNDDESLFLRNLPIAYLQKEELNKDQQISTDLLEENEFGNANVRFRGFYRPLLAQQQQDARFFFGSGGITNLLMRTATFTITSTLSITSIQPCIPAGSFSGPGSSTNACRRRKRQILNPLDASEDTQFPITPSVIQQVVPTALTPMQDNRQLSNQPDLGGIISSKDEVVHEDLANLSRAQSKNLKDKRFLFNNQIMYTTVTQYSVISTVTTKTILPGSSLLCLPNGAIVCPLAG